MSCNNITVHAFDGVGAEIRGLNLSEDLSSECREYVFRIWNEHQVVLFRNQNLNEETMLEFARAFGEPKPAGSRGYYMRAGNPHGSGRKSPIPEVSIMSNMDENGKPVGITGGHGSQAVDWHQDDSYTNTPARGALLYNTVHPINGGGNTSFCDLYGAYEALDDSVKELIDKLHLVHDISRNSAGHVRPGLELPQTYDDVVGPAHPLVITHPLTERKALHLGRKQPAPSSYILEMFNSTGHDLFTMLWEHAISPQFVWTHSSWRPGDLVIWDNLATMHKRSSVDRLQKREMLRVLLRGPSEGLVGVELNHGDATYNEQERLRTIRTTANDNADREAALKDQKNATVTAMQEPLKPPAEIFSGMPTAPVQDVTNLQNGTLAANASCEATGAVLETQTSLLEISEPLSLHPSSMYQGSLFVIAIFLGLWGNKKRRSRLGPNQNQEKSDTSLRSPQSSKAPSERYLAEQRIQVFWVFFLGIYLYFQSFSCGRADRLWRISDVFNATPQVLLKPFGISYLWFEMLSPFIATVEGIILLCMCLLVVPPYVVENLPRRWLSFICGLGWVFLHAYEHSLTGGSHTHLMPAICMMALALPPYESIWVIRHWNVFLLFSAGLCKLFNGNHHPWWAWMDGQSMQFYFENSRQAVPEPFNTLTLEYDWFAAAQCTGSVIFECSTFLLLFSRRYRLIFPFLGAGFHGMIWYTLGVNYLTSVVIQFTLVLDADDWKYLQEFLPGVLRGQALEGQSSADETRSVTKLKSSSWFARAILAINPIILVVVILKQVEFWPLSNIPMYSGYRPAIGYNTTHIANLTYLENLVNECAPHVWSRHWTDVMLTNTTSGDRFKMTFCAPSRVVPERGVKDFCLIPDGNLFDTERHNPSESQSFRLEPPSSDVRHSMRPGGWNRQKPIVVVAEMPGRYHVYCQNNTVSPAEDWLIRNCAFLRSMGIVDGVKVELVVHLGTGDLVLGSVQCEEQRSYPWDKIPSCIQSPW